MPGSLVINGNIEAEVMIRKHSLRQREERGTTHGIESFVLREGLSSPRPLCAGEQA